MRTALKILKENLVKIDSRNIQKNVVDRWGQFKLEESTIAIVNAINEARKEAIEECAENAKTIQTGFFPKEVITANGSVLAQVETFSVDKQSILNLINELQ